MVVLNMRQADQLKKLCWICLKEENKISKLKSDIKLVQVFQGVYILG